MKTRSSSKIQSKTSTITSTITLTFGDCAENHVGMQKVGQMVDKGFTIKELEGIQHDLLFKGCKSELVNLNEYLPTEIQTDKAAILIIRGGATSILERTSGFGIDDLKTEQLSLDWDTKAKMRGKVVNKRARHNLCYADYSQEPDYENGKGRIVDLKTLKVTNTLRTHIINITGKENLALEGNLYYDITSTGIGFHGDSERRLVIGVRIGESMSLHYSWFLDTKPIGKKAEFVLNNGDIYFMSEKAAGTDWKRRLIPTLRHAAGCKKYTTLPKQT